MTPYFKPLAVCYLLAAPYSLFCLCEMGPNGLPLAWSIPFVTGTGCFLIALGWHRFRNIQNVRRKSRLSLTLALTGAILAGCLALIDHAVLLCKYYQTHNFLSAVRQCCGSADMDDDILADAFPSPFFAWAMVGFPIGLLGSLLIPVHRLSEKPQSQEKEDDSIWPPAPGA